jgi:gliding motility-associated-like protein
MTCKSLLTLALVLFFSAITGKAQTTSCPPNLDFELGTYANWHYYRGAPSGPETDGGGCCPINTPTYCGYGTPCAPSVRQQLMTGAGTDPCCSFPVVPPGAGAYAMKLGNASVNSQAEKIRYYVSVPAGSTSYSLFYRYAVVLQDPGHLPAATTQPRFEVRMYDSITNAPLPCAQFSYVTSVGLPGFYSVAGGCGSGVPIRCKAWTTQSINLSRQAGTTVAIDFATGDCSQGAHFGYAYLDLSCGMFAINSVACGATTITLTAPANFAYYQWHDSTDMAAPALGTLQTIVLPTPTDTTVYACIVAPYPGFGCPDTVYTRVVPSNLQLHCSNDTTICTGASVTLTDSATDLMSPITHSWSPAIGLNCTTCGTVIATPTVTTTYTVTATNPVGCTKTDTIRVAVYPLAVSVVTDSVACFGFADGSATVTATDGAEPYTYAWTTVPAQTSSIATGMTAGHYSVVVTTGAGCQHTTAVTIDQPLPRNIIVLRVYDDTTCSPYPSTPGLAANGRITLKGITPKTIQPGLSYTVQYDYNGGTYSQYVTAPAGTGDSVQLINLPKGTYSNITIVAVSAPGEMCPYNVAGPVTINDPAPPVNAYINDPVACEGSAVSFITTNLTGVPTGASVSYSWSGPLGFGSGLSNPVIPAATMASAGTYTFAISTHNGTCHDTAYSNVTINPLPRPTGATSNSPLCSGDILKLTEGSSNGADSYSWNGANGFSSDQQNPTVNNIGANGTGTYTVTLIRNGCKAIDSVKVKVNPTPAAPIGHDTVYCQYDIAAPMSAAGNGLTWYDVPSGGTGSVVPPTPSTASPGTKHWYITQTSAEGCTSDRARVAVKVYLLTNPKIMASDSAVCLGNKIQFTAAGAAESGDDYAGIRWTFDGNETVDNVNPVYHAFNTPGDYMLTGVATYHVCKARTFSKTISVYAQPFLNLGADKAICPGSDAILLKDAINGATPGAKWLWSSGETTQAIKVTQPGTYTARVTINGCSSYDTVEIARDCYLDIPNAFSPNGDGSNDYFFPRNRLSKGLTAFSLNIYNRWGELIFQTENVDGRGWDGSYNGIMQSAGVYVYIIKAEFKDGRKEHQQGNVTILK